MNQRSITRQKHSIYTFFTRMLALLLLIAIPMVMASCDTDNTDDTVQPTAGDRTVTDRVRMDVTYYDEYRNYREGSIVLELYGNLAPITVTNFTKLVSKKFYDGLTFHRVIEGFMIQGGCPKGNGTGDSGERIKGEFANNGVPNDLAHERGVISMARGSYSMDSASCQFFIMHKTSPHLDGDYAAFGKVVSGMDVVDAIATTKTDSNDKPVNEVVIQSMYLVDSANATTAPVTTPTTSATTAPTVPNEELLLPTSYVRMDVSYTDNNGEAKEGTIYLELYGNLAPITVANFTKLVSEQFYDGLTFHRIIENFMIQGGCPNGDGTGDSGERIKGEFASNGVQNDLKHERGVISMARALYPMDSASCQFFIVHKTSPHLDGDYAAFGKVVSGLDVVDAIATLDTNASDRPLETVTITSATIVSAEDLPQ